MSSSSSKNNNYQLLSKGKKTICMLSLLLCLSASLTMCALYFYIKSELQYVISNIDIQQNYSTIFYNLLKLQTSYDNFIQTGQSENYQTFLDIDKNIKQHLAKINQIKTIEISTQQYIRYFTNNITNKIELLESSINMRHNSNILTFAMPSNNYQLIADSSNFVQQQNKSLESHKNNFDRMRKYFMLSLLIFAFSLILFAYIAASELLRNIVHLSEKQDQLNKEKRDLESKIKLRTKDLEDARALAEKERQRVESLLQDTSHRIGNSLATVASLLSMQANKSKNISVSNALISARDRIQTIATAHRRLRLGDDMETTQIDEFLRTVINDIEYSISDDAKKRISIIANIQKFCICSRDATTLGIVVGELITNAIKHAFPPPKKGHICVFFGKSEAGKLEMVIEDNGIGLGKTSSIFDAKNSFARSQSGLGMLVAKQLCLQFNSEPIYEAVPAGGTKITINLENIKIVKQEDDVLETKKHQEKNTSDECKDNETQQTDLMMQNCKNN